MEKKGIFDLGLSDAYSIIYMMENAKRAGVQVDADLYLRLRIAVNDNND